MKQIVSNYIYSPTTNVVTLTGVNIDADQLLLIVAPEVGRTMYNFASVTGTVSAGVNTRVTLNASTVGLTTTSPLVIFYDDQAGAQSVTGTVALDPASLIALENVTVTIGSAVTISGFSTSSLPPSTVTVGNTVTISGTVTANLNKQAFLINDFYYWGVPIGYQVGEDSSGTVNIYKSSLQTGPLPIQCGIDSVSEQIIPLSVVGTVTIGSLPAISGTVTVGAMPNGSLTTRFGTPTTANTAFATSAVTNASRKYLLIQNVTTGSNVITVGIGFTPTTTQGIQLTAGAGITFESSYIPTGAVYVLSSVTASNFTILEA
jgi:hypothetical protein